MPGRVVVDASLALKWVIPSEKTEQADHLFEEWADASIELVGPPQLFAEVASVLRNKVYRREIGGANADDAFDAFCQLGITKLDAPDLHVSAWVLAKRHNRPDAYDAHYLALAESHGCEFWTADERLVNAIAQQFLWIRTL